MVPQLVAIFWRDVEDHLVDQLRIPRSEAVRAIEEYRREVEGFNVGEAIYNRGTQQVAQTISESTLVR